MGEARGAALAAIAEAGLEIFEIAPRKVKQAVVGYGAAQKSAVAKMVQRLLNLPKPPAPDAADALALALAHAQENQPLQSDAAEENLNWNSVLIAVQLQPNNQQLLRVDMPERHSDANCLLTMSD